MNLKDFMDNHYNGLSLTPDFYHKWDVGIHLELGKNIYQFDQNGRLNMDMFHKVYQQVSEIVSIIFNKTDDVLVVVNSYPGETKKAVYPNFFKGYVKENRLKYSLNMHEFQWQFDDDHIAVQQMTLYCKVSDLKFQHLLKALIHEDFPSLQPRLKNKHCLFATDVFLINLNTNCIFHLYDDRGCEIMNANLALHERLLETFDGWALQVKPFN